MTKLVKFEDRRRDLHQAARAANPLSRPWATDEGREASVTYGDFWARCASSVDEVIAAARDVHQASLFACPDLDAWYKHVGILRRRLDTLHNALLILDEEAGKEKK